MALFRLAQEAVTNSLKHSEAEEISVKVEVTKDFVTLIIKDDGRGFDMKDVKTNKNKSFGLLGMKERVDLLEGKMTIDSKIGLGTFIMIRVPLTLQNKIVK